MANDVCLTFDLEVERVRATAADTNGVVLTDASAGYATFMLQAGWAEQRPEEWWRACVEAIAAVGREIALADVGRVAVQGELRGAVFLDGEMEVIRPALLSTDARWGAGFGSVVQWLRGNQTIAFKRVQHLLTPLSYVRFRLTGELVVDRDDASSTELFDVGSGDWSAALCEGAEINMDLLSKVVEHYSLVVREDIPEQLGLRAGVLVVSGETN